MDAEQLKEVAEAFRSEAADYLATIQRDPDSSDFLAGVAIARLVQGHTLAQARRKTFFERRAQLGPAHSGHRVIIG